MGFALGFDFFMLGGFLFVYVCLFVVFSLEVGGCKCFGGRGLKHVLVDLLGVLLVFTGFLWFWGWFVVVFVLRRGFMLVVFGVGLRV